MLLHAKLSFCPPPEHIPHPQHKPFVKTLIPNSFQTSIHIQKEKKESIRAYRNMTKLQECQMKIDDDLRLQQNQILNKC